MNCVEKVKFICKERKIPISRLERDLGYANGYISQLRKGTLPNDRLVEIANYLNVPVAYLTGEEQEKKPPAQEGEELEGVVANPIDFIITYSDDPELMNLQKDAVEKVLSWSIERLKAFKLWLED